MHSKIKKIKKTIKRYPNVYKYYIETLLPNKGEHMKKKYIYKKFQKLIDDILDGIKYSDTSISGLIERHTLASSYLLNCSSYFYAVLGREQLLHVNEFKEIMLTDGLEVSHFEE